MQMRYALGTSSCYILSLTPLVYTIMYLYGAHENELNTYLLITYSLLACP